MRKIRIIVADAHSVLRAGLRVLLGAQPDMVVVGEAANGPEIARAVRRFRADVLLADLDTSAGGMEPIRKALEGRAALKVLILTAHDDPVLARTALAAGVAGYVVKTASESELFSAIRAVHRGHTFVDATLNVTAAVGLLVTTVRSRRAGLPSILSDRESEVLAFLSRGHTNREIAEKLSIGVKTVETYRAHLGEKLGLRTRADCVEYALQIGLLSSKNAAQENQSSIQLRGAGTF